MTNEDMLAQYRREVTAEEAGLALMAGARCLRHGVHIPERYLRVLMALAVEKHAPKAEIDSCCDLHDCGLPDQYGCKTREETRNAER